MSTYISVQRFITFFPYFPPRLVFSCSIIILHEKNISNFVSFPHVGTSKGLHRLLRFQHFSYDLNF